MRLRELGGGYTLASDPATEQAAKRLFSRPRASTLTPAQAETLAIVAYLQPISRPEDNPHSRGQRRLGRGDACWSAT